MKLLDVVTSPWAIIPDKLLEIRDIYLTHMRGEKIDIAAVEARIGQPLANDARGYEVVNGVAVLPLEGVIAQRMNLMSRISGGTSSQLFAQEMKAATDDPSVNSIIISVDSPGGVVAGTETAAAAVRAAALTKPVIAHTDGVMASAAYWIAAAADQIIISGQTTSVGSIGVVAVHVDVSRAQDAAGLKTTEIAAGKYKRIASQYAPLSEEGRKVIQDQVDYLYAAFVDAVAQFRGVSVDKVLADMADGRVFIGTQAVDAGLADGVSSLDELIADLAAGRITSRRTQTTSAGAALPSQSPITEEIMELTKEKVAADYPQIAAAFRAEGAEAAAAAERQRIQDVEAQSMPGHEALIAGMKFDGKTTGPEAAVKVLGAERCALTSRRAAQEADAPPAVAAAASQTGAATSAASDAHLSVEDRCKAKWEADASIRGEFGNLAEYTAFEKASASGRVKVLGK